MAKYFRIAVNRTRDDDAVRELLNRIEIKDRKTGREYK